MNIKTNDKNYNVFNYSIKSYALVFSFLFALLGQLLMYYKRIDIWSYLQTDIINHSNSLYFGLGFYFVAIILFIYALKDEKFFEPVNLSEILSIKPDCKKNLFIRYFIISIVLNIVFMVILIFYSGYNPLLNLIWLVSIISGGLAVYYYEGKKPDLNLFKINKEEIFFLVTVTILYTALALTAITIIPGFIETDEGNYGNFTRILLENKWQDIFSISSYYHYPFINYLPMGISMSLFGDNLFGLRLASFFVTLFSIPLVYLGFRFTFNKNIAALSAIILVASDVIIAHSRIGHNHIQPLLVVSLIIFFMFAFFRSGNRIFIYLSGVSAGVGFYAYFAGRIFMPLLVFFFAYCFILCWKKKKELFKLFIIIVYAFTLVTTPLLSEFFKDDMVVYSRNNEIVITQGVAYEHMSSVYNTKNKIKIVALSFKNSLLGFIHSDNTGSSYDSNRPVLDFLTGIFFTTGFFYILLKFKDPRCGFLIIFLLIPVLTGWGLTINAPCAQRILFIMPYCAVIAAISLHLYVSGIINLFKSKMIQIYFSKIAIFTSIILIIALGLNTYTSIYIMEKSLITVYDRNVIMSGLIISNQNDFNFYLPDTMLDETIVNKIDLNQPSSRFILKEKKPYIIFNLKENNSPSLPEISKNSVFVISEPEFNHLSNIMLKSLPAIAFVRLTDTQNVNMGWLYIVKPEDKSKKSP